MADYEGMRTTTTGPAPTYTIVHETSYFPVRAGWVWRECLVRTATGDLEVWDIPQHRLGSAR